jgi:hypothetical protein
MTNTEENNRNGFLGISPEKFAEVDVNELVNNETAIKMLLHYYTKLTEENKTQKNDINTYKTYVEAYDKKKSNSSTSTILLILSNLSIAFSVNLLTQTPPVNAGWFLLVMGGALAFAGLHFSFWKDK